MTNTSITFVCFKLYADSPPPSDQTQLPLSEVTALSHAVLCPWCMRPGGFFFHSSYHFSFRAASKRQKDKHRYDHLINMNK